MPVRPRRLPLAIGLAACQPPLGLQGTFYIVKVSGSGPIVSGDQVGIRTYRGYYVVAEGGGRRRHERQPRCARSMGDVHDHDSLMRRTSARSGT